MALSLLYTGLFALCGLCIATLLFAFERLIKRIWYGLVLGLLLLTWLPSLLAFFIGFNLAAQIGAGVIALLLGLLCLILSLRNGGKGIFAGFQKRDLGFLWVVVPLFLLGAVLFSTHILKPLDNGGVAVGQVTYGDLAMHLGFISSIAAQGVFPPEYSIFPGHTVNYPFLCETSASSLVVLGANLRQAYLMTALYAYLLVLIGVWFFVREWLRTNRRAHIATLLFFLGSGFGFAYWFDLAKHGASLNTLLDGTYFSNFSWLLDGFYDTPTNLPTIGLRWVNPIVDMLIPQRATLFGWAFLFPCLTLLHGFTFRGKQQNILPLGLIAGLLPLIHTHSFLALGIISAVYCIGDLVLHFEKKRLGLWVLYAGLACVIGMPQLFGFAFAQASESGMVQPHWNWANEADSYLWFYLKNWGWLFALLPVALLTLSKRDRHVFLAPAILWIIAEVVVFQPNNYDNNKLLFITFAYVCGMVGKWLDAVYRRMDAWIRKRSAVFERIYVLRISALLIEAVLFISLLIKLRGNHSIAWYTICTLLFLCGLCLFLLYGALREAVRIGPIHIKEQLTSFAAMLFVIWPIIELLYGLWRGYAQTTLYLDIAPLILTLLLLTFAMLFTAWPLFRLPRPKAFSAANHAVALQLAAFVLTLTLSLSSTMTILRELKSEYQVYSESDLEVAAYIRENTEPDDLFLANSYLWNLVTPTTGRSIVTGTSTFLYFHGIDNTEREADVRKMYEAPASNEQLFRQYGVDYVLVSNAERYQYDWDEAWFNANGTVVFANGAARIYRLHLA
ncbi:MAG: hypothetical protein IJ138_03140 [Clostridia bacterium]|nr:hypothetical protein [Clostridia bacterium]